KDVERICRLEATQRVQCCLFGIAAHASAVSHGRQLGRRDHTLRHLTHVAAAAIAHAFARLPPARGKGKGSADAKAAKGEVALVVFFPRTEGRRSSRKRLFLLFNRASLLVADVVGVGFVPLLLLLLPRLASLPPLEVLRLRVGFPPPLARLQQSQLAQSL